MTQKIIILIFSRYLKEVNKGRELTKVNERADGYNKNKNGRSSNALAR